MPTRPQSVRCSQDSHRGAVQRVVSFTLVELLIVVVILGILAAIIIPQFTNTTADAKLNALTTDLELVRRQIQVYQVEHNGALPAFALFEIQMTSKTNPDGTAAVALFFPVAM